ncbi:holliday junction resolvasome [Caudoviricetes sp.]|nr:holliday junction resolvasome [Caudoviricetes sp.]
MRYILGIDPGLKGALALLNTTIGVNKRTNTSNAVKTFDIPIHRLRNKDHVDTYQLAMWIDAHSKDIDFVVIEDVSSMPNQGVVSMFRFGEVKGILTGIVSSYYLPLFFIKPSVWKMSLGLSKDKDHARQLASKLYPHSSNQWPLKKHADRAEALLIAHFGFINLKGSHAPT